MTKRKPLFIFARAAMTLLVMLLTTATAWAQDSDPVASVTIGETTTNCSILYDYWNPDAAINIVNNAYADGNVPASVPIIKLLKDISLDGFEICNGWNEVAVILDLNSKTISSGYISIDELATLTITDNSTSKNGKIIAYDDYCIVNDGILIIEGGEISGGYEYTILNNGSMTLNNGSIVATSDYEPSGIGNNGTLTVSGGTISVVSDSDYPGTAIRNYNKLTVSGGTISVVGDSEDPGAAIMNYNELTISGGNIINSAIGIYNNNWKVDYDAILIITTLPTFSNNDVDISFNDSFITFTENISSAPTTPIKVNVSNYPFTINYSTYCSSIPPSRMFQQVGHIIIPDNGEVKGIDGFRLLDDSDNSTTINNHYNHSLNTQNYNNNYQLFGRTLYRNGDWNTLCLPFSMTATQITNSGLSGATIKELDADASSLAANGVMTLTFKNATADSQDGNNIIKAGKPYIVRWNASDNLANIIDPVFEGVTISVTEPTAVEFGSNCKFVGQFSPFLISDGSNNTVNNIKEIMMMGSGSTVGYSNTPRELKCFRAHFEIPATAEARAFQINFDDEDLTGIVNIERQSFDDERSAGTWYSLDGRKLSTEPQLKGVYIHNGKKVIIK